MPEEISVLLLNPPGTQNYLRDYYCSKTSKSDYTYTPVDFLYISAYLQEFCELSFLDCVKENIDADTLLKRQQWLSMMFPEALQLSEQELDRVWSQARLLYTEP